MKKKTGRLLELPHRHGKSHATADHAAAHLGVGSTLEVLTAKGTFETLGEVPTASLLDSLGFISPPRPLATIRFKDGHYAKGFVLPPDPDPRRNLEVSIEVTEVGHERDREGAD